MSRRNRKRQPLTKPSSLPSTGSPPPPPPSAQASTPPARLTEEDRASLEAEKIRGELRLKEQELSIKREEIAIKQREIELKLLEHKRNIWLNPINLGVLAALIGVLGTVIAKQIEDVSNRKLEQQRIENASLLEKTKLNSSLILEAIKTGDQEKAAKNLAFLVEHQLIDDPDGKIRASLANKDKIPVLPATYPIDAAPPPPFIAEIIDGDVHMTVLSKVERAGPSIWQYSYVLTNRGSKAVRFSLASHLGSTTKVPSEKGEVIIEGFIAPSNKAVNTFQSQMPWKTAEGVLTYGTGSKNKTVGLFFPSK